MYVRAYNLSINEINTHVKWQANFAWWEPGHGRFRFSHPWKQYLKTGVLIRQCAYHIEALNGYLNTDIQVNKILNQTLILFMLSQLNISFQNINLRMTEDPVIYIHTYMSCMHVTLTLTNELKAK